MVLERAVYMGMGAPLCSDAHCAMTMLAGAGRRIGSL